MLRFVFGLGICLSALPLSASIVHVPTDYPTIQAAVDAAGTGDTILVAPGTYGGTGNRDIDFGGKNLVLKSEQGPEVTIIDCQATVQDQHMAIYLHTGEDSTSEIDGFTIQNAYQDTSIYDYQAAIRCRTAAPTIRNCILRNNSCAGIYYYLGPNPAYVYSTRITSCGFSSGYQRPGLIISLTRAVVESCQVDSCTGSGAYLYHSNPVVRNSVFADNQEHGLLVVEFLGLDNVQISGCTSFGNQNGLVYFQDWPKTARAKLQPSAMDTSRISGCLFVNNRESGFLSDGLDFNTIISCCDVFGNGGQDWRILGMGSVDTTNCYAVNPLFCSPMTNYEGVSSGSFCLSANNDCGVDIGRISAGCGPCCVGIRGNVDYDPADAADIGDIVYFVEFAFAAGPRPPCADEADVNGDGGIDIGDLIYLVEWSMAGGPAPASCPQY